MSQITKDVPEAQTPSPVEPRRSMSFCVIVDSHLPVDDTRTILNTILDAGLADAARTVETDVDGELRERAQHAIDMNVHAPTLLDQPRVSPSPTESKAPLGGGEILTVYAEAYAADDDGDGPSLAEYQVDAAFLERLSRLHAVCVEHALTEVRVNAGPEWGPYGIEDELRLQNDELVVTGAGDFWFVADVKHNDYHVETRSLNIAAFMESVRSALTEGDDYLVCGEWFEDDAEEAIAEHRDAKEAAMPSPH